MINNTYVGNLGDAMMLAIEKPGIEGETFNIRDERLVTREEFVNTIADYLGKPHPRHVPEIIPRLLVGPIERIAKLRGRKDPPFLTRAQIKFMTLNLDYSIAKAKRVLGYAPPSISARAFESRSTTSPAKRTPNRHGTSRPKPSLWPRADACR